MIWYIDEDKDDLFTYKKQLQKITQEKIDIRAVEPLESCFEMAEKILTESKTVAAVIDQRLGDTKHGVSYSGLDLAKEIRKLNDKLPIYILTNHSDDLTSDEWEIEYVFSKDDFIDNKRVIAERIKRHIDFFFTLQDKREKRFAELLKKSISTTLTDDELKEIENLDYFRSSALLKEEAATTSKLKEDLDKQEELLNKIKEKLEGGDAG